MSEVGLRFVEVASLSLSWGAEEVDGRNGDSVEERKRELEHRSATAIVSDGL
jgi:hypothetical protein